LHEHAVADHVANVARARRRRREVVLRDHPAERDPRERVDQAEHGIEHLAADVLEVDVDALRARVAERGVQLAGSIIDRGVGAELLGEPGALLAGARGSDHAAPENLSYLHDERAGCAGGPRDHERLARLRLADFLETVPAGEPRYSEHPEERGGR